MLFDDVTAGGESYPRSALARFVGTLFGRKEWVEYLLQRRRIHARTKITYDEIHRLIFRIVFEANDQSTSFEHGLSSIDDQIHQDLLDLIATCHDFGDVLK